MTAQPYLTVSEVFGPTMQGEGPAAGRPCAFIRLMGCNLTCSWCDTPYTWDARRFNLRDEGHRMHWEDILAKVVSMRVRLVVVSGGEPLLHQHFTGWRDLLRGLKAAGINVHVETNGTVIPNSVTADNVTQFIVSPKLKHAGMPLSRTISTPTLRRLNGLGAHFKFVCRTALDVDQVGTVTETARIPARRVWVMPEGTDPKTVCDHLSQVAQPAIDRGFNVTSRLHVLAWGDERGR